MSKMQNPYIPDPDSFAHDPSLISRKDEISQLEKYFESGGRVASITGATGTGKTSLIMMFARPKFAEPMNHHLFPGGILYTNAVHFEAIEDFMERHWQFPLEKRSLLVIDELHSLSTLDRHRLRSALHTNQYLNLILSSQENIEIVPGEQLVITLSGFSYEDFQRLLKARIDLLDASVIRTLFDKFSGNPLIADIVARSIQEGTLNWNQVAGAFDDFKQPGIFGPDGRPIDSKQEVPSQIIIHVRNTNEQLLDMLRRNPAAMRSLPPRKFEEIVAELLIKQGYDVELTPTSSDGGFDMYVARQNGLGQFLYLVECKRYTPPKKVGVEVIRGLYGVVQKHNANAGIIVTTSFFTKGAVESQQELNHQIHLRDYIELQKWLGKI